MKASDLDDLARVNATAMDEAFQDIPDARLSEFAATVGVSIAALETLHKRDLRAFSRTLAGLGLRCVDDAGHRRNTAMLRALLSAVQAGLLKIECGQDI